MFLVLITMTVRRNVCALAPLFFWYLLFHLINTDGHDIARAAWRSQVLITNWYFFSSKVTSNQWFFTNIMFFFYSTLKGDFCCYFLVEPSNIFTALEGMFVSIPHPLSSVRFSFILHNLLAFSFTSLLLFAANVITGCYVDLFITIRNLCGHTILQQWFCP